ncbi:amidohydrolase [Halobacillus mangrovi]|uniref:Amidohydrolase 3 domain-containing protein n=1 Tax=Halobacillus mangrovi TaxID=402384 RepID=A0A1W5ZT02_9BACI|nr:amidohydrolase [Halobacillus mangrovi]ARI76381.1 hypothetical protein HM131_05815 [Halobacillus mangrovi]
MRYDQIIYNGNIITLEEGLERPVAVGVKEGSIKKVWKEEIRSSIKADEWIDLDGRTLIPGFIDTHNHLFMYARQKVQLNCSTPPNLNISDLLELIRLETEKLPDGEWIVGYGYDDTLLEESRHIFRHELDKVAPHHPVFIRHISGHLAIINSKALEYCDIPDSVKDPSGGHFGRGESGFLNGILYELPVLERVMNRIPRPSVVELVTQLEKAAHDYLKEGITTSTDAAVGLDLDFDEYRAHVEAVASRKNPLHMRYMILYSLLENGELEGLNKSELHSRIQKDTEGRGKLDSVKLFQDGSIQGYTAALRGGYYKNENYNGDLVHKQEDFNNYIEKYHNQGHRIAIHGNGDLAIASIIEAYTNALDKNPKRDHKHRIEHLQTAKAEDLDLMQDYEIATSLFINHIYYWGDRHREIFLGPERASQMNPTASVARRGLLYTLHSDCPITPISPLFSIWAAANRITRDGHVLGEEEKVSVQEALKSMTIYGARLNGTEEENGSIKEGKRADFAVLETNLLHVDPIMIKDVEVDMTIIDGEVVYQREIS